MHTSSAKDSKWILPTTEQRSSILSQYMQTGLRDVLCKLTWHQALLQSMEEGGMASSEPCCNTAAQESHNYVSSSEGPYATMSNASAIE